jgi:hypothetical protein
MLPGKILSSALFFNSSIYHNGDNALRRVHYLSQAIIMQDKSKIDSIILQTLSPISEFKRFGETSLVINTSRDFGIQVKKHFDLINRVGIPKTRKMMAKRPGYGAAVKTIWVLDYHGIYIILVDAKYTHVLINGLRQFNLHKKKLANQAVVLKSFLRKLAKSSIKLKPLSVHVSIDFDSQLNKVISKFDPNIIVRGFRNGCQVFFGKLKNAPFDLEGFYIMYTAWKAAYVYSKTVKNALNYELTRFEVIYTATHAFNRRSNEHWFNVASAIKSKVTKNMQAYYEN